MLVEPTPQRGERFEHERRCGVEFCAKTDGTRASGDDLNPGLDAIANGPELAYIVEILLDQRKTESDDIGAHPSRRRCNFFSGNSTPQMGDTPTGLGRQSCRQQCANFVHLA